MPPQPSSRVANLRGRPVMCLRSPSPRFVCGNTPPRPPARGTDCRGRPEALVCSGGPRFPLPAICPRQHPLASVPLPQPRPRPGPGPRRQASAPPLRCSSVAISPRGHSCCRGRPVVLVRSCEPRFPCPPFGQGDVPSRSSSRAVIAAAVPPRRSAAATSIRGRPRDIHGRPREALIPVAVHWPRPLPAARLRRHAKCGRELRRRHLSLSITILHILVCFVVVMWWCLIHVDGETGFSRFSSWEPVQLYIHDFGSKGLFGAP